MPGAAVLDHVGEQLGRAEVGDRLDRGRRALGQVDDQLDGHVAARGEGGERGAEAVVQDRRVDATGQVAQLDDGLLGAAVRRVDQLQGPLHVGLGDPGDRAAELLPGQAQLHGHRDHLGLGPIVQVPLDPAQPRGRVVHRVGPALLQFTHPVPQRRPEQPDDQLPVLGVAPLQPPRAIEQRSQARRNQGEGDSQGMHRLDHQQGIWLPPHQPSRHVDHHAVGVQDLPPDRKGQIRDPPSHQVDHDDRAQHREQQLEQQVGTGPPAGRIGQHRPDPAEGARLRAQRRRRLDLHPQQPAGQAAVDRAEPPGAQQGHHQQRHPDQHASETERHPQADGEGDQDEHKAGNREQQPEHRELDLPPGIPGERRPQQLRRGLPEPDPVARGSGGATAGATGSAKVPRHTSAGADGTPGRPCWPVTGSALSMTELSASALQYPR